MTPLKFWLIKNVVQERNKDVDPRISHTVPSVLESMFALLDQQQNWKVKGLFKEAMSLFFSSTESNAWTLYVMRNPLSVISTYNDSCLFTNISVPSLLCQENKPGSIIPLLLFSICQVVKLITLKNEQRCNIIQFRELQGGLCKYCQRQDGSSKAVKALSLTLSITSATADVMPGELSLEIKKMKSFWWC